MVNLLGWGQLPCFPAFLTERVFADIAVTNPLPCAAIAPLAGRIAPVFVIMRRDNFLVFLTIAPVGQARASGIGTGALWFIWHNQFYLLPGRKKAPAVQSLQRLTYILAFVAIVILPDFQGVFLCLLVSSFIIRQIVNTALQW